MKLLLTALLLPMFFLSYGQNQLLYISTESGNFDIYKMDLNTRKSTKLTENPGWDWSPKFLSAAKQVFYYSTDTTKNFEYRLMDLEGNPLDLQLPQGENMLPSPKGNYYTFTRKSGDNQYIFLYDPVSGESRKVIAENSYNGRVCWKKDGSGFAFISDRDGNNEVYFYSIEKNSEERITNDDGRQKYLAWSPGGRYLLYSTELSDTSNQLNILQMDNRVSTVLTTAEYIDSELSWSPDGKFIAFHSNRDQGDQIYMINIASKVVEQLTWADAYHGEPEWIND